jgi:hypothetical protein
MAARAVIRQHICVSPAMSCDTRRQGSQKVRTVSFNAVKTKFRRICSDKTTGKYILHNIDILQYIDKNKYRRKLCTKSI